ncbi:MAG: hypothetical protein HY678_02835 [Chloroflexi bacterium]|nr:hypothetical protein [Chloroflexota bacterium]
MRLRPKWLLHRPDSAQGPKWFATHQRIWSEIRRDPSYEPDGLASNQTFIERGAGFVLGEQREIRQTILSGNSLDMRLTDPELDRLARRLSDWDRWWRTSTAAIWESALLKNSPYSKDYRDYASAYLDLRAIRSSDLFRFWLLEVATERLPRNYLQALVSWEQMNVKPTPGNALDQIHCDKLFDVDVMVTADQAMFKVVSASVARVKALPRPDRRGFRKMARIALVDRGSTDSAEQIGAAMARF